MSKQNEAQSMELAVVQTAITRMDKLSEGLKDLTQRFAGVIYDVKTPKGMAEAKAARREVAEPRIAVEKIRVEAKKPILELGRKLDAEAKRITAELDKIEAPIALQIKTEEDRVEEERLAKVRREEQRIADITQRIQTMRNAVGEAQRMRTSAEIVRFLAMVQAIVIDLDHFAEYMDTAALAKREAVSEIERIRDEFIAREKEAARVAAENEQLRKDREAFELRKAEQDEKDRKARAADEAAAQERNALANTRMSEIHSIGHQTIIARSGRLGVREGGTRECIVETLAETEAWTITEEKFGPLLSVAQSAKDHTVSQLRQMIEQFDAQAAQRAESERIAEENRKLEARQQAERDAQAERDRKAEEARQEQARKELAEREANYRPSFDEIVAFVAAHFGKPPAVVRTWITEKKGVSKAA